MSKFCSNANDYTLSRDDVERLENQVEELTREKKENEYVILHYKAQIRLLHDTLKNMRKASAKALEVEETMLESLESKVERGFHLKHTGEEVTYPGEETLEEYRKRKAMSSGAGSSSDSSS